MYIETVAWLIFSACVIGGALYLTIEMRRYSKKRSNMEADLCSREMKESLTWVIARLIRRWHSSIIIFHTFHTISKVCAILSVCFSILSLLTCDNNIMVLNKASCAWISAASIVFVVIAVFLMPNRKISDSSRVFKCCDYKLNKLIVEKETMKRMNDAQALTKGYEITAFIDRMEMSNISDED